MKITISKRFAELVTGFPKTVLFFVAGLLILSSFNLKDFKLDASSDSLVLESDDDLKYYREVSADYSSSDFLIVIFEPKEDLFSKKVISQVRSMVDSFTEIEGVESVLSYLDAPLLFSPKMPMTELVDNLRTLEDEGVDLSLAKKEFQSSPLYTELLTDSTGEFTALQLLLEPSTEYDQAINKRYEVLEEKDNELALALINEQIKSLNTDASIKRDKLIASTREVIASYEDFGNVYLGGTAMIASDMISFIKSDLRYFALGVLIMFIITLGAIFKKARWVAMPLASSGFVALFVIGLLGLMDWRVTVVSSNFISLLLIITISLTIHLIVRYQEISELHKERNQKELVSLTIEQMLKPCFYTALTTIIAFASLGVSEIKPVIDFGRMMVAGIFFAFLFAFTLVPAVMVTFFSKDSDSKDFRKGITLIFSNFTSNNAKAVITIAISLLVLSYIGISKLTVENRFIDYFKSSTEIYKGMELLDQKLGGTAPLDIVLNAPSDWATEEEGFDDDFGFEEDLGSANGYWWNTISINKLEEVHDYVESLPEIGKVLSVASGIKVARELNDGEELSELDLALLKNMLPEDIKDSLLSSYISQDENQVRISARVLESSYGLIEMNC